MAVATILETIHPTTLVTVWTAVTQAMLPKPTMTLDTIAQSLRSVQGSAFASSADAAISSHEIYPTLVAGYSTPTDSYGDYESTYGDYSYYSAAYTSGNVAFGSSFASATGAAVGTLYYNYDILTDVIAGQLRRGIRLIFRIQNRCGGKYPSLAIG